METLIVSRRLLAMTDLSELKGLPTKAGEAIGANGKMNHKKTPRVVRFQ